MGRKNQATPKDAATAGLQLLEETGQHPGRIADALNSLIPEEKRSWEKLQRENDISRVTHKKGNENVLWKAMGQRYTLRGLGDKAGRMRALQERYVSSLVRLMLLVRTRHRDLQFIQV